MQIKESTAVIIIIFILILLSQSTLRIGREKFDQVLCSAHLTKLYSALIVQIKENPYLFAENPDKPWYVLLGKNIKQSYLTCPSAKNDISNHQSSNVYYAMNQRIYTILKAGKPLPHKKENTILFIDSEIDPIGFQLFPLVNPAFPHNGGSNVILLNGTTRWIDKDSFGKNTTY